MFLHQCTLVLVLVVRSSIPSFLVLLRAGIRLFFIFLLFLSLVSSLGNVVSIIFLINISQTREMYQLIFVARFLGTVPSYPRVCLRFSGVQLVPLGSNSRATPVLTLLRFQEVQQGAISSSVVTMYHSNNSSITLFISLRVLSIDLLISEIILR